MDSNDRNNLEEDNEINNYENNFYEESILAKEMSQCQFPNTLNSSTKGKTEENNDGMKLGSDEKGKNKSDNDVKNEIYNYFQNKDSSIENSRKDEALILIYMKQEVIDSSNIQKKDNSFPTNDEKIPLNTNNNVSIQDNSRKNSNDKLDKNNSNNNNSIRSENKTNIIKLKETEIIQNQKKEVIEDEDFLNLDEFDYTGYKNLNYDNDYIYKDLSISKDAFRISTNKSQDTFPNQLKCK